MIDTDAALAAFLPSLETVDPVAIDTEADSLHCYFEKLCLVQISTPAGDFLVDPLATMSLEPLYSLLAGKELILHGADYDLRLLRRTGFGEARAVFDTMIAARLAGETEFSLAALILKYFGVALVKGSQKANWARRPLSPQMEEYAKNDTHFLLELAAKLDGKLRALDRWEWFRQSCGRAVEVARTDRERDRESAWRITGSNDLRGRSAAILRALWQWRDDEARAADRPAFHILHNEQLIDSAQRLDRGERVFFPRMPSSRARRFAAAAAAALEIPSENWPVVERKFRSRPTPQQDSLFSALKKRRDEAAASLQLDPSLIAPKAMLENLALNPQENAERLLPWQRALLEPIG